MVFLNTTFSWKQTIIVVLTLDPIPSSNPDYSEILIRAR
jgi:hypothetical protein